MTRTATPSPAKQLDAFIAKYSPAMAKLMRAALKRMRAYIPDADQMVYDNYNALVVGFGPSQKASQAIFSIALLPDHASLCFLQGATLEDPKGLLLGSGNVARHIKFKDETLFDNKDVKRLKDQALLTAKVPMDRNRRGEFTIKSVSAKQRPRRP